MDDDQARELEALEGILSDPSAEPIKLSYGLLKFITENFSNEIGRGEFGVVYKGDLQNGVVAVKKISNLHNVLDKQFMDEIKCLKGASHKNIVRFLGYCAETQEEILPLDGTFVMAVEPNRLLCFEYISNGNIRQYLEQEKPDGNDQWHICYKIIKGVCQGLHYLHEKRIIHLDLKPENVMLDDCMEPKITHFGVSRFMDEGKSIMLTGNILGTLGYIAPEMIRKGHISFKTDIYALGFIIIRLLTGRNIIDFDNWHKSIDQDRPGVTSCIEIARSCVETDEDQRPTIGNIIVELDEIERIIEESTHGIAGSSTSQKSTEGSLGKQYRHPMEYLMEKMSSSDPQPITLQMLKAITEDFSEKMKIGSGGYGQVYKGLLNGDEIAIKKFFPVAELDDEAFENEFRKLKKVQHKNIIRMIGYCYEISHRHMEYQGKIIFSQVIDRALCSEYMKGGSLANHISEESCIHDWPTTFNIITGTCEGLYHLHHGGEKRLFHLDLKPDNVLLDEKLVPKIGDFGLSWLFGTSYTHERSFPKRTIQFMPPEYINNGKMTPKNDVFSLGVIIFHMMAGAKGYDDYQDGRHRLNYSQIIQQEFIERVEEHWKTRMQASEGYRRDKTDLLGVTRCIKIAMRCVKDGPDDRPSIKEILEELKDLDFQMQEMLRTPKPLIGQQLYQGLPEGSSVDATDPMVMTFQELHRITDGFSEKRLLGKGGFGKVYKGIFDNGEVIAVKKLDNKPGLVEDQFKNELLNLITVKHENIIRLVGYCSEAKEIVVDHKGKNDLFYREERALCLEYLQGGNLEELLSDKSCELDWEECYRIIKGVCEGLKHLHTGSKDPIYHLDLKPANILLDSNRIPKIGDFGLSRLCDSTETFLTKTYAGTNGYMPPEYMHRQLISPKFDVFSLGVIIIEIIAGPDGYYNYKYVMSPEKFIDHVRKQVTENWSKRGAQAKTMLPQELLEMQKCIKLALRCVKGKQAKRPSITEIVEELNMISKRAPFDADAVDESTLAALSNS